MKCNKCGATLTDSSFCNNCGSNVKIYKKLISTSNALYNRGLEKAQVRDLSGAKDDLNKATHIAREMVCNYGMSSLGNISLDEVYIRYNYDTIRLEIKKITDSAYKKALQLVEDNQQLLYSISEHLMEHETIDKDQIKLIYEDYKKTKSFAYET